MEYEANRWFFSMSLRVENQALPELERILERHIRRTGNSESGSTISEVEMAFDSFEHARSSLLAYGEAVEVIEPEALRLSMADFARRILETYES